MNLAPIVSALVFALGLWWSSTGAILWLVRRPRATYRLSLAVGGVLAVLAASALVATRDQATPAGAFTAFAAAVALWGWHELSFLTGLVTGPSDQPCPAGARGWARFRAAAATLMHHELALAVAAAVVAALTLGRDNPVGGLTVLTLFAARLSAKLNLFLGVPNFSLELFPPHLAHLKSYLRKGPVSALYPLSLVGLSAAAALAAARALDADATAFTATGYTLIFALLLLAAVEHVFMALPRADTVLWRWALPAADPAPRVAVSADAAKPSN